MDKLEPEDKLKTYECYKCGAVSPCRIEMDRIAHPPGKCPVDDGKDDKVNWVEVENRHKDAAVGRLVEAAVKVGKAFSDEQRWEPEGTYKQWFGKAFVKMVLDAAKTARALKEAEGE
jgi:hypothetical protein